MLEQKIEALTAAIEANTAALLGGGAAGSAKTTTTKTTSAKTTKAKGPVHSVDEVHALVTKIGAEHSKEIARGVLNSCGLQKLAEVTDANADAVFDAATAKYEELQDDDI